jgi:hypothetical protein
LCPYAFGPFCRLQGLIHLSHLLLSLSIYNVNNIAEQYAVSPSFAIHNVSASAGPSSSVTPGYVVPASAASNLPSGVRSSTSGAPSASASGFGTFSGSGSGGEFWVVAQKGGGLQKGGGRHVGLTLIRVSDSNHPTGNNAAASNAAGALVVLGSAAAAVVALL